MKSKEQKRLEAAIRQAEYDLDKLKREYYKHDPKVPPDKWAKDHKKRNQELNETIRRLTMDLSILLEAECKSQVPRR